MDFTMHKTNRAILNFLLSISKIEKILTTSDDMKRMQRQSATKPTSRMEMWNRRKFVTRWSIVSNFNVFQTSEKHRIINS